MATATTSPSHLTTRFYGPSSITTNSTRLLARSFIFNNRKNRLHMQNLSEKVLVVNLNIRRWPGLKYDETVTKQVDRDHNATNAGRYTKILIEKVEFKRIQKAETAIRSYYYEQ